MATLIDRIVDYVMEHARKDVDRAGLRSVLADPVEELEDEYGENFMSDEDIEALFIDEEGDILDDKYPELWGIMYDVIVDIQYDYLDDDDDDKPEEEPEEDKYHFNEYDDEPF